MKKVMVVLLLLGSVQSEGSDARAKFKRNEAGRGVIRFGGRKDLCGAMKVVNKTAVPVKLLGNGRSVVLGNKGDSVHFKYSGLGTKALQDRTTDLDKWRWWEISCYEPVLTLWGFNGTSKKKCPYLEKAEFDGVGKSEAVRKKLMEEAQEKCDDELKKYLAQHKNKYEYRAVPCSDFVELKNVEYNKRCNVIKPDYKPLNFK